MVCVLTKTDGDAKESVGCGGGVIGKGWMEKGRVKTNIKKTDRSDGVGGGGLFSGG